MQGALIMNEKVEYLLYEVHESINQADFKANIFLAGFSVILSAIFKPCLTIFRTIDFRCINQNLCHNYYNLLFCIFFLMLIVGFALFVLAAYPRLNRKSSEYIDYFGDIDSSTKVNDAIETLKKDNRDNLEKNVDQFIKLSNILRKKYICIRIGTLLFSCGLSGIFALLVTTFSSITV